MNEDKMLERIRALLAKAEDPGVSPHERDAYTQKAAELLGKYGIDQAMLASTGQRSDEIVSRNVLIEDPYALDKSVLLNTIARYSNGKALRMTGYRGPGRLLVLVGYESDLDRIELLYTSLLVQASYGLAARSPRPGENTTSYRKSWLAGFTYETGERLEAAQKYAQAQANRDAPSAGTDLVLADRGQLVTRAYNDMFPRARTAQPRRLNGSGHEDGAAAGRRADHGTTRFAGSRKGVEG